MFLAHMWVGVMDFMKHNSKRLKKYQVWIKDSLFSLWLLQKVCAFEIRSVRSFESQNVCLSEMERKMIFVRERETLEMSSLILFVRDRKMNIIGSMKVNVYKESHKKI